MRSGFDVAEADLTAEAAAVVIEIEDFTADFAAEWKFDLEDFADFGVTEKTESSTEAESTAESRAEDEAEDETDKVRGEQRRSVYTGWCKGRSCRSSETDEEDEEEEVEEKVMAARSAL